MKFRQLGMAVLAVIMVAACDSRRETPTSTPFGTDMLSGQVAVSGLPNGSPAGVQVSVRGTGQRATLGESGEFFFAGVGEGAQLDFVRETDGIEATLRVDSASQFLSVELTKTSATASGRGSSRRRGVSATREVVYEFEGTIISAAADSLVMLTSKGVEQTIGVTADTILRHGNTPYAAADLTEGTRIHVKAKKNEDGSYTAVVVLVQNVNGDEEDEGAPAKEYEGIVRSASATRLVVFTSHGEEKTFVLNAGTVIRKGNTAVKPEDIQVGWRVHVRAATADGVSTASLVIIQNMPAEEVSIEGPVASVGASSFVVTTTDGAVTVKVSSSTQIRKGGKKIALSGVQAGDTVAVEGTRVNATTVTAKKVTVG
jgi:hypothetical protein